MLGNLAAVKSRRRKRGLPEELNSLTVHERSLAEMCLGCGIRVDWTKQAAYLQRNVSILAMIHDILPLTVTLDIGDKRLPTSLCAACYRGVHRPVPRKMFIQRFVDKLKELDNIMCASTRGCSRDDCGLCIAARVNVGGVFSKRRKLQAVVEVKETVLTEPIESPPSTCDTQPTFTASDFATAGLIAGQSGRQTIQFAKALGRVQKRSVVSPGMKDKITEQNQIFKPFCALTTLNNSATSVVSYISDMKGFCELIFQKYKPDQIR